MIVAISGAFDPIHPGHISLMREASKLGDRLVVILKGDGRLRRKKGSCLMNQRDRAEIVRSIRWVDQVYIYDNDDPAIHQDDFSEALEVLKPDVYCAGADRESADDLPQVIGALERLGVRVVYGVGGDKIHDSSEILRRYVVDYVTKKIQ